MFEELAGVAAEAARVGAQALLPRFRDSSLRVEAKATHDFVTTADRESEDAILGFLAARLPDHSILSEESGLSVAKDASDFRWIVDPLDGTTNFLQGLPIWGISIACLEGEELAAGAIFEPLGDNLFTASRDRGATWNEEPIEVSRRPGLDGAFLATGYPFRARGAVDTYLEVFRAVFLRAGAIRRCGAACLDLAYTAAGVFDGFFEFRLSAWDIAAGALLIREAGGRVSDLDRGERFLHSGNVVAGGPSVFAELSSTIGALVSEADLDRQAPLGGAER